MILTVNNNNNKLKKKNSNSNTHTKAKIRQAQQAKQRRTKETKILLNLLHDKLCITMLQGIGPSNNTLKNIAKNHTDNNTTQTTMVHRRHKPLYPATL